jgi:cell division protein FtsW
VNVRAWLADLRAAGSSVRGERGETDRWLVLLTFLLLAGGLAMVLSASSVQGLADHSSAYYYFVRQLALAAAGVAGMLVLWRIDYHRLSAWAPAATAVVAVLMLAVLVPHVGVTGLGAKRWLSLGPLGTFEPSEAAKLVFCVYMAQWVDRHRGKLDSFSDGLVPFGVLTAATLGVLLLQRDLGTAVVMCGIFVSIYFVGGGPKRYVVLMLGALALAFAFFVMIESYRQARLTAFLDPFHDRLGINYQASQALLALGSGGLTGVGLGHSVQKYLWLPEAHTDFIYAIIGEETGLIGTTLVLAGFVALIVRGYRAAARAPDRLGLMLATGITTWIGFQALINMATVTVTLPATGLPLPFISYGGSALAITLAAMGILLNVAAQAGNEGTRRRIDASADLGRRNWRTPFAGSRRRSSVPRRASGS